MEVFCHINELGPEGWPSLRLLTLAFSKVILWGPSASQLDHLCRSDSTCPTPAELLWYVNNGNIQILAREWWLQKSERRLSHRWEHAREWSELFDGQVLQMWHEDERKGRRSDARVIACGDETGADQAPKLAKELGIDLEEFGSRAGSLPGYAEKAARAGGGRAAGLSVLRDAWNHGEVFARSGAARNLGTPEDLDLMQVMTRSSGPIGSSVASMYREPANVGAVVNSMKSVVQAIQEAGTPSQNRDEAFERTKDLLQSPDDLMGMRQWLIDCERAAVGTRDEYLETELREALADEISSHAHPVELWDYMLPRDKASIGRAIVSMVLAGIGWRSGSPLAPYSIGLLATTPAVAALRRIGWMPEMYDGPRWPFYLAEGSSSPTRQAREAVVKALRKH